MNSPEKLSGPAAAGRDGGRTGGHGRRPEGRFGFCLQGGASATPGARRRGHPPALPDENPANHPASLQDEAIVQNIESLLSHPEGRNFAQALQDSLKESLRETIDKKLDDRQFEYLVKWYMEKLGAQAEIPSKNSSEKPDGADADVIATFDKLNVALYIQVKKTRYRHPFR